MKKTSVVALGIAAAFAGCCGLSALFGQSQRTAREAAEEQQGATEEASTAPAQADPRGQEEVVPSAPPRVPAWQDPSQMAGEEAGAASGLTYSRIFELSHRVWLHREERREGDPAAAVAEAEGVPVEVVDAACAEAADTRTGLEVYLSGKPSYSQASTTGQLHHGVSDSVASVGSIKVEEREQGPLMVFSFVTLKGCPERVDLGAQAEEVMRTMIGNLPPGVTGLEVNLWYSGQHCRSSTYGRGLYIADGATVTITRR